jgi:uncharacterized Zn finger protein (UPF0148 family)
VTVAALHPTPFNRTLEQELTALVRGASLECLVCGEFVMHCRGSVFCPECGFRLEGEESPANAIQSETQAG